MCEIQTTKSASCAPAPALQWIQPQKMACNSGNLVAMINIQIYLESELNSEKKLAAKLVKYIERTSRH